MHAPHHNTPAQLGPNVGDGIRACRPLPRFAGGSGCFRQKGAIAQVVRCTIKQAQRSLRENPPRPEGICVQTDDTP